MVEFVGGAWLRLHVLQMAIIPYEGRLWDQELKLCLPIESAQRPVLQLFQVDASSETGIRFDSLGRATSASKIVHMSIPLLQVAPFTRHRVKSPRY